MKKLLSFCLKLSVSSALLYFFLREIDLNEIAAKLKNIDKPLFLCGALAYMSTLFISARRWALFLPDNTKYSRLVSLYFIGAFFNTFLPGLVGGDAVKAYYLYKDKSDIGPSLASLFMDRYLGMTALALLGLIAFIGGHGYLRETTIFWAVPAFFLAFLLASLIFWNVNWGKIKFLGEFHKPLMEFRGRRDIILNGLILSMIIQSLGIISFYLVSLSLGFNLNIIYFFLFIPIITAATVIPISIAGSGIREAGFVILFSQVGLSRVDAISLSFLVFLNMVLVRMLGGIEFLRIKKSRVEGEQP
ncbi:MAG: flippase-like domain-containing protein [Nitrospirae bacterium]|nr:flippase-like domain-containing protein [Nitrospirota bacterium]